MIRFLTTKYQAIIILKIRNGHLRNALQMCLEIKMKPVNCTNLQNFNIALSLCELHFNMSNSKISLSSASKMSVKRLFKPFVYGSDRSKRQKPKSLLNDNFNKKNFYVTKTNSFIF